MFKYAFRLSPVFVYDEDIRLKQHCSVYFEVHIKHVSIGWPMLNLKSAARIQCCVALMQNAVFHANCIKVGKVFTALDE